jgi:hypothetical protein
MFLSSGRSAVSQSLYLVEHGVRDLVLASPRYVSLAARDGQDRDLIVLGVKSDSGLRDVVDHHGVKPLALELLAPIGERAVAMFRREPHEQLAGAPAPR